MKSFVVLKHELAQGSWREIACANADTPGEAFRTVVLRPGEQPRPDVWGEYRVLPLDDGADLAVRMHLRDLDAPPSKP
jgi:hypothetical protein